MAEAAGAVAAVTRVTPLSARIVARRLLGEVISTPSVSDRRVRSMSSMLGEDERGGHG
jgi:hypothetical protein